MTEKKRDDVNRALANCIWIVEKEEETEPHTDTPKRKKAYGEKEKEQ